MEAPPLRTPVAALLLVTLLVLQPVSSDPLNEADAAPTLTTEAPAPPPRDVGAVFEKVAAAVEAGEDPRTIARWLSSPASADAGPACPALDQDDAGSGGDAGDDEASATPLGDGDLSGCLGGADREDWYLVTGDEAEFLTITVTIPTGMDYDVLVTDCAGAELDNAGAGPGVHETVRVPFRHDEAVACVGILTAVSVTPSSTQVALGAGPYGLHVLRGTDACVQDDAASGRDATWADPVAVPYGTYAGCLQAGSGDEDSDFYAFDATADGPFIIEATRDGCGDILVAGIDEEGDWVAVDGSDAACGAHVRDMVTPSTNERYAIGVYGDDGAYTLTVRPATRWCDPQDDAASGGDAGDDFGDTTLVTAGTHAGCLDDLDTRDLYNVTVAADEVVTVTLAWEEAFHLSSDAALASAFVYHNGRPRDWSYNYLKDETRMLVLPTTPGNVTIALATSHPGLTYDLTITRGPASLTGIVAHPTNLTYPGAFTVCGDDLLTVDDERVHAVDANGSHVWADPAAREPTLGHLDGACDADGNLYLPGETPDTYRPYSYESGGIIRIQDGDAAPILEGGGRLAFSPGGDLVRASDWALDVTPCATRTPRDLGVVAQDAAFAPDGALYATSLGDVVRVDLATGATTTVAKLPAYMTRGLAFDAHGTGYAVLGTGAVVRFDPATGATDVVAKGVGHAAFHGDRLWVTLGASGVGYLDATFDGFEGFEPACPFPYGDLAITEVREVRDGLFHDANPYKDQHLIEVDIANVGAGSWSGYMKAVLYHETPDCTVPEHALGTFPCASRHDVYAGSRYWRATIAPGAVHTVVLRWDTLTYLGDADLEVRLERPFGAEYVYAEPQTDLTNDAYAWRSNAQVQGVSVR